MKKPRLAFLAFNITYMALISLLYYNFIYCEFCVFPRPKKEARPQPNEEALLPPTTPGASWTSSFPPLPPQSQPLMLNMDLRILLELHDEKSVSGNYFTAATQVKLKTAITNNGKGDFMF